MKPKISIIVAMDNNRLIGVDGQMPWHIPEDLKYFKQKTLHSNILMGRKTYESIGKALPERINLVMTKQSNLKLINCKIVSNIEQVLESSRDCKNLFIIGGAEIYNIWLDYAHKIYLTKIDACFKGNKYFPYIKENNWKLLSTQHNISAKSGLNFTFNELERIV